MQPAGGLHEFVTGVAAKGREALSTRVGQDSLNHACVFDAGVILTSLR